jgi:type IV secretory pathway VirB4 component
MLNLAEYRKKTTSLCDYLPWACLIGPGIVLNKDGSFQRTLRYRGPDLDSATEAELVSIAARLNNVLKRFGDGWALFFEASACPPTTTPAPASVTPPRGWSIRSATPPSAPTAPTTRADIISRSSTCRRRTARAGRNG